MDFDSILNTFRKHIIEKGLFRILVFFTFYLLLIPLVNAQEVTIDKILNLGNVGDQKFPVWSPKGQYLAYQSNQNGNWDVFLYDIKTHHVRQVTFSKTDEVHPVWVPGKYALVYDSKRNGAWHLYYKDLNTGREKLLFRKKIQAHEASFSPSGRLVAFSGFVSTSEHWQIYTYDLVFNNLNLITKAQGDASFPAFSPDGHFLAYHVFDYNGNNKVMLTNWFGNFYKMLCKGRGRLSWTPDSWRLLFLPLENGDPSIVSIGQDASGYRKEVVSESDVATPAISPDGAQMAYAIKTLKGWRIILKDISY